ncbi:hypothetical protein GWI33_021608 [Rhynchophorus ferrugineus]|uniref:Uncharacterized protein n=1 Tax=Rhynchophorus ferrugineus TaxID=354439 RepID=A0A834IVL3_RHYFE|nr:hypothetical protein GWI33_021608 [Rhynchophorus ferrugineus]
MTITRVLLEKHLSLPEEALFNYLPSLPLTPPLLKSISNRGGGLPPDIHSKNNDTSTCYESTPPTNQPPLRSSARLGWIRFRINRFVTCRFFFGDG